MSAAPLLTSFSNLPGAFAITRAAAALPHTCRKAPRAGLPGMAMHMPKGLCCGCLQSTVAAGKDRALPRGRRGEKGSHSLLALGGPPGTPRKTPGPGIGTPSCVTEPAGVASFFQERKKELRLLRP